jgi:hypothetical protein
VLAIIALIPGRLAAWIGLTRGPHAAFLTVYLPTMLLLPEYYRWNAPGLPDPTFGQAAAVGTAIAFFARGTPGFRFHAMDLLVYRFALAASISEYRASGYSDAQNLMFNMLTWMVLPYIFAKSLIEPAGNRVRFAKTLVVCLVIISAISVYEFRFGTTPWRMILDPFFPGQARWVTTFRWGFARVAGPYGHAILAGILIAIDRVALGERRTLEIHVPSTLEGTHCRRCGKPIDHGYGLGQEIRLRHLPVFDDNTVLVLRPKRYQCRSCEGRPTASQTLSWYTPRASVTKAFEQQMLLEMINSTLEDVSLKHAIGVDALQGILDRRIEPEVDWTGIETLEVIGIDAIALTKGHRDFVVVISAYVKDRLRVIALLPARNKAAVETRVVPSQISPNSVFSKVR